MEGVQVEEIYSLEEEQFKELKPVYGLIFLFKWVHDENPQGSLVKDSRVQEMFFAKQVRTIKKLNEIPCSNDFLFLGHHKRLCHSSNFITFNEFGLS